jgi:esterase/lipase
VEGTVAVVKGVEMGGSFVLMLSSEVAPPSMAELAMDNSMAVVVVVVDGSRVCLVGGRANC